MFELLLARHGQTDWNVERRVMGAKPIPLSTTGKAQARLLAKGLKDIPIHAVYSSPIRRAIQTAQPILKGRDSVSLFEEPGLTEIDYGDWVGRPFAEIPELNDYFQRPSSVKIPNGETLEAVRKRAASAVERMRERHKDQRILAISHADVIKFILIHYLGMVLDDLQKFRIDNASVSVLHFNSIKTPRIVLVNGMGDFRKYCHL